MNYVLHFIYCTKNSYLVIKFLTSLAVMNKHIKKQKSKKSGIVTQKQAKATAVKIEAVKPNYSSSSYSARRFDKESIFKSDNLRNTGGAVIIHYLICCKCS